MMNEESLKKWEQKNIKLLTSREMGEWLYRRDMNRDMKERPQQNSWRDQMKEHFRNAAKNDGDVFRLYEIEAILDGEVLE